MGGGFESYFQYVYFEVLLNNLSRSVYDSIFYLGLEKISLSPRLKSVNYCHRDGN